MPRLHSASHYHSRPHPPSSIMSSVPLLHHHPHLPSFKSRPLQSLCSSNSSPPRPPSNHHSKRIHSSPGLLPMASPSPACSHRLSKSVSEKIPPSETTLVHLTKPNRKSTPKRTRRPRDKAASTTTLVTAPPRRHQSPIESLIPLSDPSPTNAVRFGKPAPPASKPSHPHSKPSLPLYDLCDQLSTKSLDRSPQIAPSPPQTSSKSSRTGTKKRSTPRGKHSKGSQPLVQACLQSSDAEDLFALDHSIFLSNDDIPSRTSTPSPVHSKSNLGSLDDNEHAHGTVVAPPSAHRKSCNNLGSNSRVTFSLPRRQHVRAKSVASIFDVEKRQAPEAQGAKDDWDMPSGVPSRDLTWQQLEKKQAPQTCLPTTNSSPISYLTQSLSQHNTLPNALPVGPPTAPITLALSTQNSKETSARRQRTSLCRTSSAGLLTRLCKPTSAANRVSSSASRSDDESTLTWQQTILRPLPKNCPSIVADTSQHKGDVVDTKLGHSHKKKLILPVALKTPCKFASSAPMPRKAGVNSASKSKSSSGQSHGNRRNSLCSARVQNSQSSFDLPPAQEVTLEWKSFPLCTQVMNHHPRQFTSPPFSDPFPSVGSQPLRASQRRHAKSYTDQPAVLPDRLTQSHPPHHNIPDSQDMKMMTPSKSRTTSEDLNLVTPGNKLESSALRAAIMYAGPQFHNSPCPAALPAPKFSCGSA